MLTARPASLPRIARPVLLTVVHVTLLALVFRSCLGGAWGEVAHVPDAAMRLAAAALHVVLASGVVMQARRIPRVMVGPLLAFLWVMSAWVTVSAASSITGQPPPVTLESSLIVLTTLTLVAQSLMGFVAGRHARAREAALENRDSLTTLLHRSAFLSALAPREPAALVLLDLNLMRLVNEERGQEHGDGHLRAVALAFRDALPPGAIPCRWAGDQFAALLPGGTPDELSHHVARALSAAPEPRPGIPAFAYGVAAWNPGDPFERAYALADQRRFDHKRAQRDRDAQERLVHDELNDVTRDLERFRSLDDILTIGLPRVARVLGFDAWAYLERRGEAFVPVAAHAPACGAALVSSPREGSRGLLARVLRSQAPTWATDYPSEPDAHPAFVAAGVKSAALCPVFSRGRLTGVLVLLSTDHWRAVTPQVRRILETIAGRAGHVLDLTAVTRDVRGTLEGGLLGLGVALEARDLETVGHTQRVVRLAERLGVALGLSGVPLEELRQGAFLHDIGKLGIPDAVLLKPATLTLEEREVMRTHALRGVEIASRIPTLSRGALDVIRSHHEWWNGHGYPDGLAGEAIPLLARIFAVVDVYDALVSERPYKRAWSSSAAVAELEANSGVQFDPRVVRAFVSLLRGGPTGVEGRPSVRASERADS